MTGDGDQCRVPDHLESPRPTHRRGRLPGPRDPPRERDGRVRTENRDRVGGPAGQHVVLIKKRLPTLEHTSGFAYHVVFDPAAARPPAQGRGTDDELIIREWA